MSDSIATISRHLVLNSHIKTFSVTITTMDDVLKYAKKLTSNDGMKVNPIRISFHVKKENKDLYWYWNNNENGKGEEFIKDFDINKNSLPEDMKSDVRSDIMKRLQAIGGE